MKIERDKMANIYKKYLLLLLIILTPLLYCFEESSDRIVYSDDFQESTYDGSQYQYFLVPTDTYVNLTYQLHLSGFSKKVYFIFTNTSTSTTHVEPILLSSYNNPEFDLSRKSISPTKNMIVDSPTEIIMDKKAEITAFNQNPPHPDMIENSGSKISRSIFTNPPEPRFNNVGDTQFFYVDKGIQREAKCANIVTVGDKTLNIWVDVDKFDDPETGTVEGPITEDMVLALSNKFLTTGSDNDIYDYVTNIYGAEWGSHSISYMLDPDAVNNITILLFDIDCYLYDSVPNCNSHQGTMGYFYAKDNYKLSPSINWTNERLMFYIDSEAFAEPDGTWAITDEWPARIVSTLIHEFQHMIHFYQKKVKQNLSSNSDAWIDEMCSMVTEDLVASKVNTNGPRGMDSSIASTSTPESNSTRLDDHNLYNYYSVTSWANTLGHYGHKYAFGAYLARNYNGASLFQNIVQNEYVDHRTVTNALTNEGYSDDFGTILRKWGIANLLSDKTDTEIGVRYNQGSNWMDSTVGTITYSLGAIDLFAYSDDPIIYNISDTLPELQKSSNIYVDAGTLSGDNTWEFKIPSYIKLTVVVRDDDPTL